MAGTSIAALGLALLAAAGCSPAETPGPASSAEPEEAIASASFEPPVPWSHPIDDYLAAGYARHHGLFRKGIHDLVVHEGRLYLAYGDAQHNLGDAVPIALRYLASPDDPTPVSELVTDEHEIRRFRLLGSDLVAVGMDAVGQGYVGNLYVRGAGADARWRKRSALAGGVHVHDVAEHRGFVYAVGSGADDAAEWQAGRHFAYLWRAPGLDGPFETVQRLGNRPGRYARFVRLLSLGDVLYVFGDEGRGMEVERVANLRLDGADLAPLPAHHPLAAANVLEADPLLPGRALVRGAPSLAEPLSRAAWEVREDGGVRELGALAGRSVVDVYPHPATGEVLFLSEGTAQGPSPSTWDVAISVTRDLVTWTELVRFSSPARPESVAWWRGRIVYGTWDGEIWQAPARRP